MPYVIILNHKNCNLKKLTGCSHNRDFSFEIKKKFERAFQEEIFQVKEKLRSFLRKLWRAFIDTFVHKIEWTLLMRNRMMGEQYWNICDRLPGRKYFTQIAISIKGSKITEEVGPKDLIKLNKSFTSLFYFDSIMQGKTNIFWALWVISE